MPERRCPLCNETGHTSMTCPSVAPDDHLRNHLTDGQWHDSCPYCRHRRVHGGNGVEEARDG